MVLSSYFQALLQFQHRRSIIGAIAMQHQPAMYPFRFFVIDGGFMSYGARSLDFYKGAASYVDRGCRRRSSQLPTR